MGYISYHNARGAFFLLFHEIMSYRMRYHFQLLWMCQRKDSFSLNKLPVGYRIDGNNQLLVVQENLHKTSFRLCSAYCIYIEVPFDLIVYTNLFHTLFNTVFKFIFVYLDCRTIFHYNTHDIAVLGYHIVG